MWQSFASTMLDHCWLDISALSSLSWDSMLSFGILRTQLRTHSESCKAYTVLKGIKRSRLWRYGDTYPFSWWIYLFAVAATVLIHDLIHHGLMLQSAMARVCSAAHSAGLPKSIELTMSEQAALKSEGKRLRRAAENGIFAILGSTKLLQPVMQWCANDGPSPTSGSIATKVSENRQVAQEDSAAASLCVVQHGSCMSSGPLRDKSAINQTVEATSQHTMGQGSVLRMPSHGSGDQVRELLDQILHSGAASVRCGPQHVGSRDGGAAIPNTLLDHEPNICADDVHEQSKPVNNQTNIPSPGTLTEEIGRQADTEVPALEGRILQIQQDLEQVCLHLSHAALHSPRWLPQQCKGDIWCRSWRCIGHS